VRITSELWPTRVIINKEMVEGDDYKIEGPSNKNKMKRKTRKIQNKRDVMNAPFMLSSHVCFFYLHTFQLNVSCITIKQFYSGHAKNQHG
jgi:hypothetical protein